MFTSPHQKLRGKHFSTFLHDHILLVGLVIDQFRET